MSAEHVDGGRLAAYARRRLAPGELLAIDDHLAVCDECRGRLDPALRLPTVFRAMDAAILAAADATETRVRFDQLASYVDNTIDDVDREIVDSHAAICR